MERLLASPLFRHSNRYPRLLRFSVEAALENPDQHPKERFVGVTVFGRDPDYDTNLDPIVRTTAVEVRKRIAEYYRQPGRDTEPRIDLPAGSYVAELRESPRSESLALDAALPTVVSLAHPAIAESPGPVLPIHRFPQGRLLIAAFFVLLCVASVVAWNSFHTDALETFWRPILQPPAMLPS